MSARREFDAFVGQLRDADVEVLVFEDRPEIECPDAVFPNNWFTTHRSGKVFVYPMAAESRRLERRNDILDALVRVHGLTISEIVDLTGHESFGRYLEGTGSLMLDRRERTAYACLSSRTDAGLVELFCDLADYDPFIFDATDRAGRAVYHTNVMMCIGKTFATVCLEAVRDVSQRAALCHRLQEAGLEIIEISMDQMHDFAGNMLQLGSRDGDSVIALSARARKALYTDQLACLSTHGQLVSADIDTIEQLGGGSVRCMLAEVYLPAGVDKQLPGASQ